MRNTGFIAILFFSTLGFGQNKKLDSLHQVLASSLKEDTIRVKLIFEIVRMEFFSDRSNAVHLAKEAIRISEELRYIPGIMRAYGFLGDFYYSVGDIDNAGKYGMKMIELSKDYGISKPFGAYGYYLMGAVHSELGNDNKAISYYKRYLEIKLTSLDWRSISAAYNNIGSVYSDLGKYDSAIHYLNKSVKLDLERKDLRSASSDYLNLARNHLLNGGTKAALLYYHEGLKLAKKFGDKFSESYVHNNGDIESLLHLGLAELYVSEGRFDEAVTYADSVLIYAKKANHHVRLRDSYFTLFEIAKAKKNYGEALQYQELHLMFKDSVSSDEKVREINNLEARYGLQQKEQAIRLLDQDKSIATLWRNIAFASLILIVIISTIIISTLRFRERKNRELFNQRLDLLLAENQQLANKYRAAALTHASTLFESQDHRMLNKVVEIIELNISDSLFGVEKLATELGMSRDSLHRRMKKATGFPPSDFIRSMRLKRAAAMLRSQTDNVAQVGFHVGFSDQSYFSKSFKKQFGISPSDFMKSEKGNGQDTPQQT